MQSSSHIKDICSNFENDIKGIIDATLEKLSEVGIKRGEVVLLHGIEYKISRIVFSTTSISGKPKIRIYGNKRRYNGEFTRLESSIGSPKFLETLK